MSSISERQPLLQDDSRRKKRVASSNFLWQRVFLAIGVVFVLFVIRLNPSCMTLYAQRTKICKSGSDGVKEFSWDELPPSHVFTWTECFERFQCTRLLLPLDYSKNDSDSEQTAIAIIRLPSKFPSTDSRYQGPIFINPGGPGGSAVETIIGAGPWLSPLLDDQFDLLGFDPRGIGSTTPKLNLFPTDVERKLWDVQAPPPYNSTADALARAFARSKVVGDLAVRRAGVIVEYMSTKDVARDLLEISKAYGEEKVTYWGWSYGTLLGTTFASLYPNNIRRMILDGVVDADDYYSTNWLTALTDTEKCLDMIAESCSRSSLCPLHKTSGSLVKHRINSIINKLKDNPTPVMNGSNYGIVDYGMARGALFEALYQPYRKFPALAQALAELEMGDGRALFGYAGTKDSLFRCQCGGKQLVPNLIPESTAAVMCGDGDVVEGGLEGLWESYGKMAKMSSFADLMDARVACSGWKLRAKNRFRGPFTANTSHPILFMGNTGDPVSPISSAKKMALGFNGSVALAQNAPGHGALILRSNCTWTYINSYWRDGSLPPIDTLCEVDDFIFRPDGFVEKKLGEDGERTREIFRGLGDGYSLPRLGGM